jgi:putative oxidoreductase
MKRLFSPRPYLQEPGLFLVRLITGFFMAYHGWEVFDAETMKGYMEWDTFKGFSSPSFMVYIGKGGELLAGILLILGLFTRLAALLTIVLLSYIAFFIGHGKIWYEDQHPFMFVLLGAVFFFIGGGKYSLDQLFFNKTKNT